MASKPRDSSGADSTLTKESEEDHAKVDVNDAEGEAEERPLRDVKVVIVGDGAVGKTCLANVFVNREFPVDYEPTVFENYTKQMDIFDEVCRGTMLWVVLAKPFQFSIELARITCE